MWWMCLICGHGSQGESEEERNAGHLLFYPAHEPIWVED